MKSDPYDPDDTVINSDPSPTEVFRTLSNDHRQYVLEYLLHRLGAVAVGDLADYIAIKDGDLTAEGSERALLALYHIHLPHLIAVGLVRYDDDQETVELRVDADDIRPFLQLTLATIPAVRADRRQRT
jgi:hypothetical protein